MSNSANLEALHAWFVRLVAHDLRTPLATILTSSDILKHYQHRLSEERRIEHLDAIQMQVRALNNLLDNIMIVQKLETGMLNFEPTSQELVSLCQMAIESAHEMLYEDAEVVFRPASGSVHAVFDERLLVLALTNVITNAIKFSTADSAVEVTLDAGEDQAVIQVIDHGIGVPVDEQPRLFNLFFRASNAEMVPGKGLGLTVAARLLELHRGRLDLESAQDQGTTVTLTVPMN